MPQMSIIVAYEINPGSEEALASFLTEHARLTLHEEPGCLRFDVLKPVDDAGLPIISRLMVSEVYTDAAAIAAHRANPRMTSVRTVLEPLVKARTVTMSTVLGGKLRETGLAPEELNASNDG